MTLLRREFLRLAALAASAGAPRFASAQQYPTRPVRIITGTAAGGPIDLAARVIGQWLTERLGQQFIVENRPGAAGNIGTEAVVRAPADGYTLLLAYASAAINPAMFEKLSFDFLRDLAPVASINRIPLVLEVHSSFPANTVAELIAYAKAHAGKIALAAPVNGSAPHVAAELFKMTAGVEMVHVPYRGSAPMVTDLLGGQVQVAFDGLSPSLEHIRAGKLRALAVTTTTRLDMLPGIPTLAETLPGFEASGWCGVAAPKNTPADVLDMLNREISAGVADVKIRTHLADAGAIPFVSSRSEFTRFIADETEKWGRVIRAARIKAE